MGHSGDDVNHKKPHKMKTRWPNQLKISVSVYFQVFYRTRYKKIDVIQGVQKINFTFLNVNNVTTNTRIAAPAIYIDRGNL